MNGLTWKRNVSEILERRRKFFTRRMMDGILVSLPINVEGVKQEPAHEPLQLRENPGIPVNVGAESEWKAFDKRWSGHTDNEDRPFPSNEEILDRIVIGEQARGKVEDDHLPVLYSILDAGESMVGAMFNAPTRFLHRGRSAAYSKAEKILSEYADMHKLRFSLDNPWTKRFLNIQEYVRDHADGRFGQHPCIVIDALNFAIEFREATPSYLDLYEHPDELRRMIEIGIDFNTRFQEAQFTRCGGVEDGCFAMIGEWVPFRRALAMGVDAYLICSVDTYLEFGFEYQKRLIEPFGHVLMHYHCTRTDIAAEMAKLPGLELFQFGGDTRDRTPTIDRVPEMRKAVGNVPMQVFVDLKVFRERLKKRTLLPNIWYMVDGPGLSVDEANKLMEKVRAYRA